MDKRPLTPDELAERRRTVPLAYIAAYWEEHAEKLYDSSRLILTSVDKLVHHFPNRDAVTEQEFVSKLMQFVIGKDKSHWKQTYSNVWFSARCNYEWDMKQELNCTPLKDLPEPDLSTGLTARTH